MHHVAFRTPDADYDAWADRLAQFGIPNSGKVDRFWFRSLYVREPNGVLFEIATDGPGFAVDEDPATLGEKIVLPPFLEPYRHELDESANVVAADEASLPATTPAGFEPFELTGGRLQPAELIEDELIVAIPLVPKHLRVEDCGSLARELAQLERRP